MDDNAIRPTKKKQEKAEDKPADFDPQQYEVHKSTIAVIMGHFMLRHLNRLYDAFDGDLILPIVLGEIAHHNILRFYSRKGNCIEVHDQLATSPDWMENLEPTNAFSISQATGIPRETVRRKIDKLEKKGWIVKNDEGDVFISETVSEHFTKDFNKKILGELLETSECLKRILEPGTKKTT